MTMRERPIQFKAHEVRETLDGRKTQTRRPVKLPHLNRLGVWEPSTTSGRDKYGVEHPARPVIWHTRTGDTLACPFGQPGDRLWVRETWYPEVNGDPEFPVWYRATDADGFPYRAWRPSIHMPRWASRITLEITDVRVQRVQDISEADAIAEGLATVTKDGTTWKFGIPDADGLPGTDDIGWPWTKWDRDPRKAFATLWNDTYGPDAWDRNDWVWAVTFKWVTP